MESNLHQQLSFSLLVLVQAPTQQSLWALHWTTGKSHWLKYVTEISLIRDRVEHVVWSWYQHLAWCIVNCDREEPSYLRFCTPVHHLKRKVCFTSILQEIYSLFCQNLQRKNSARKQNPEHSTPALGGTIIAALLDTKSKNTQTQWFKFSQPKSW